MSSFVTKRSKGFQWKLEKVVTKENDRSNSYTTEKRVIATVRLKASTRRRKLRARFPLRHAPARGAPTPPPAAALVY